MKIKSTVVLMQVSLFLLIAGASAVTIQVQDVQINTIGTSMPVNIALDNAPTGLAGYDITISVSNTSVAAITNATFPAWAILNETTTFPASSVQLRSVDLYEQVQDGASMIPLGNVTLKGLAVGSTDVIVTVKNLTDDNGNYPATTVRSGILVVGSGSSNPAAPSSPVKLIFIHHSTGQNWLDDSNGGLALSLRDNNYFVSDTNYGWGPAYVGGSDRIGDHTDIGNWYDWFRGPNNATYLGVLFNESGQTFSYSRLASNPGGKNKIVMFKSCFPNSNILGDPNAAVPSIASNPMKSHSVDSTYTVANAKGIYIDLLNYFSTRQDTLFIVIAAPPLSDSTNAKDARAFNQWLVNDWLKSYPYKNVYVFDFYNVLTTNGGSSSVNDLGTTTGNHHRWWNGAVQHQVNLAYNTSAYPTGDDHPSQAGNLKATAEFVPLLNYAYGQWAGSTVAAPVANFTANKTSGSVPLAVQFTDTSSGSPTSWNWSFGDGSLSTSQNPLHTYSHPGTFTISLNATNISGSNITVKIGYITVTSATSTQKIGFFRNGFWLTDYNGNYQWDGFTSDRAGSLGQAGDTPVVGDWNGDGKDEIGFFRNGFWILDYNGNYGWDGPSVDRMGSLGQAGDTPVVGDWNGDGKDEIGFFRNGFWLTDYNGNYGWDGPSVDRIGSLGQVGDTPVVGDWNGDGKDKIGFFRNGFWLTDYNGNYQWDGPSVDKTGSLGQTGDTPVVGSW